MELASFDACHKSLLTGERDQQPFNARRRLLIRALLARDVAGATGIKMILTGTAFHYLAVLGHFESFGQGL